MKLAPLLLLPFLAAAPVQAGWQDLFTQTGGRSSEKCTKKVYNEVYVPGNYNNPGYVEYETEVVEIPCNDRPYQSSYNPSPRPRPYRPSRDGNECGDGKYAGGLLGGGLAAAISQGDGRWWAIPLGVVVGSSIGCDMDGG